MQERFDVVIVGAGAAGGWAAKELSENGLRVLLLDAGPELDPRKHVPAAPGSSEWLQTLDVLDSDPAWRERKPVQSRYAACTHATQHLFVNDIENPYTATKDEPFNWIRGRQVGGRTLFWGRVMLRLSDHELHAPEIDGYGDSWPLSHADLASHYERVERFTRVAGARDGLVHLPDGAFEPPEPATELEREFISKMKTRMPDRPVIMQRGIAPRRDGSGWPRDSSVGSSIASARATGNLTLRPDSVASHIVVDPATGRATGVAFIDRTTGKPFQAKARAVVVCASTIESIRLLLNSVSPSHPHGLGNSSGTLGCFFMDHLLVSISGLVPTGRPLSNDNSFSGPSALYIPRFRNLHTPSRGFIRGYGVQTWIQRRGTALVDPGSGVTPFSMMAFCETLPRRENRIRLDTDKRDAWGIPCACIEYEYDDNARHMAEDAVAAMQEMIGLMDAQVTSVKQHVAGESFHELGGARMGQDARTSVLNSFAQCWDAPNVFVPDGSAWTTSAYQNPTLTIMAMTGRACERLRSEMMARDI